MQLCLRTRLYAFDRPAARGNRSKELDAINAAPHNIEGDAQGRRKEVIQYKDQDLIHLLEMPSGDLHLDATLHRRGGSA